MKFKESLSDKLKRNLCMVNFGETLKLYAGQIPGFGFKTGTIKEKWKQNLIAASHVQDIKTNNLRKEMYGENLCENVKFVELETRYCCRMSQGGT